MLKKLYEQVRNELESINVPISRNIKNVVINNRARSRLGCCKIDKNILGKTTYIIEISAFALEYENKRIKEILAHELIHTCQGCFNHGKIWKLYAAMANRAYGYEIKRTSAIENTGVENINRTQENWKYVLNCEKCGQIIKRKRLSSLVRYPWNYKCSKCGGSIKRVK